MQYIVETGALDTGDVRVGDSIAVSGVCLTVTQQQDARLVFDVSAETLNCTTLAAHSAGDKVNLEKALLPTARLSGHWVSGHIDGVGTVVDLRREGHCMTLQIEIDAALRRYVAYKGSICVDGVSLTVNGVSDGMVDLYIIPHTLEMTTLSGLAVGRKVNIEVDIIARYLERLLEEGYSFARHDTP